MLRATLALPLLLLGLVTSAVHLPLPSGARKDATVLILGGGVAGVTAARTLHEQGIDDFIIIEARDELGGRLMSHSFGAPSRKFAVELGANWVQGTQTGNGAENPIWALAKKHNVTTRSSEYFGSISTYDDSGASDFRDIFDASIEDFHKLVASAVCAVIGGRVPKRLVDMSARGGYSLTGSHPESKHQMASEYYQFDWEFGTTPEETSWLASSWAHNYTFDPASGGFSYENLLSVDQRGFKTLIQAEARESLNPAQVRLNSTVSEINSSKHGVKVTLTDGHVLRADYALCTFSLGVLQHSDVKFVPPLPAWKREAIHSMSMGTYTKIFLQFPEKFWFDTEGDFSKRIESLPDSYVQSEVMDVLQMMFPEVDVPEPTDFYFQRWHSDPLFRGSYSNWPAAFLSEHQGNLRANVDERLWFAGEATSRKYFGYLHGAYTEGEAIGQTLAECIQGGGCFGLEHIDRVQNARPYDII
ncbi:amine oxidase [Fomitopsis serialis]|uniref:amine oxidase n=1 Tax=Fomitopsis serialis TaxID=139415 RepID=UPI0020082E63|nr:amine oxidase [Neoantrodia serialis]KAH9922372.1 amine oxidase [Neoantrodia serialis]